MRARPFKQSSATAFPEPVRNEFVDEALEKQAKNRPAKPTIVIAPSPELPRIKKPKFRKHKK